MKANINDNLRKSCKDHSKHIPQKKHEMHKKNNSTLPNQVLTSNRTIQKFINNKINDGISSKNIFNNSKKISNNNNSKISKIKKKSISLINPQNICQNNSTSSKPFNMHQKIKIKIKNNNPKNKKINNSNSLNKENCSLITREKSSNKSDVIPTSSSTIGAISQEYKGEHYIESEKVSPKNNNNYINNFNYESGSDENNVFYCKFNDYSSLTFGNSCSNSSSNNNKSSSKKYLADSVLNNLSKLREENEALKKELKETNDQITKLKNKIEELQEEKENKKNIFESRLSCKNIGIRKYKERKKFFWSEINETNEDIKTNNKLGINFNNNCIGKKKGIKKGNYSIRKREKITDDNKKKNSINNCSHGDIIKECISKLKI